MKALALLLATVCTLWFLYAVITFQPSPSQAAETAADEAGYRAAAMREVKQVMDACFFLLGKTESDHMTQHDIQAFSVCMHPTLTKHNLHTFK